MIIKTTLKVPTLLEAAQFKGNYTDINKIDHGWTCFKNDENNQTRCYIIHGHEKDGVTPILGEEVPFGSWVYFFQGHIGFCSSERFLEKFGKYMTE